MNCLGSPTVGKTELPYALSRFSNGLIDFWNSLKNSNGLADGKMDPGHEDQRRAPLHRDNTSKHSTPLKDLHA
ncbi:hypothetical protein D918_07431 [Trichuris suis]|nr:hypothetical protein D918_07431 [Trichuris suis]